MAGPSWKPHSPFLPPLYMASPSLIASILLPTTSCPHPSFFPCPYAQALDTPTFPFSLSEGGSFCLAGLRCVDLVLSPGKSPSSCSQAPSPAPPKREGGGGGILELG